MFVMCKECNDQHIVTDIEALNIEEGVMGEDIITFVCPCTGNETKSPVYKR